MSRRRCVYVNEAMYTPDGYVAAVVIEGVSGYYPLTGSSEAQQPWYWGHDLAVAKQLAADYNAQLGLSKKDVLRIVASSMRAQRDAAK